MIQNPETPSEEDVENRKFIDVYQEAAELYGTLHSSYIQTSRGLTIMREKFLNGTFGNCPRVLCEKQKVLPVGVSELIKVARMKVFCPRCEDIFNPQKKYTDIDGAYFGCSFPHLLLSVYPDLQPRVKKVVYEPRIKGFKISSQGNPRTVTEAK